MSSDRYPTKQTHLRRPPDFTPAYQSSPLNPNRPAGSSRSPRTPTHAMPVVRELFLEFDNIRFPGSDVLIPPGGHMPSVAEELEIRMHASTRRLNANDNYGWRSPPSLADQFPRTPKSPRAHRLPRTPKSPRTPESSSASPSSPECYRTYADPPLSPKSPRPLPTPPGRLPEPPSPTWQIPGDLSPLWHTPRHAPSIGEVIDGTFLTDESAPPANVDRAGRVPEPIPASSASDFFEVQDARNYRTTMRTLAGRYIDFRKDTGLEKMQLESERRMRSMNYVGNLSFAVD